MAPQMPPALLHAAAAAREALASLLWFGAAALVPAEALQAVTPITGHRVTHWLDRGATSSNARGLTTD